MIVNGIYIPDGSLQEQGSGVGSSPFFESQYNSSTVSNGWTYYYNAAPAAGSSSGGVAAPAPAPVSAHLQFSPSTIGTVTPLSFGRARLAGQIIFAEGISATNNVAETSTLTFAVAFCEPINADYDITNGMKPLRMWANGTQFYDINQGGVIPVANMTQADQDSLEVCIASMAVYLGADDQLADPVMERILGTGNVPAYRGLRYIRFTDFPLSIAGNTVPNINADWGTVPDVGQVDISTIMGYLVQHVYDRQIVAVEGGPGSLDFEVDGVTNQAYGLTITDQSTLIDHFNKHKTVFSYQIIDGDPIRIVRRPVDGSLTIDLDITETDDCIRRNAAPAITFSRVNPATLPVAVSVNYTDVNQDFDTKVQQATYDGTGTATSTLALNSDYCGTADENRTLAFDILYQVRAKALTIAFEIGELEPEVSDVIQLTTDEGSVYVALVDQQTYTKNRTNQIGALALLTSAGVDVPGGIGLYTPNTARPWWPQDAVESFPILVTDGKIWSGYGQAVGFNDQAVPKQRLTVTSFYDTTSLPWADTANWVGEDSLNVYFVFQGINTSANISILRVPKSGTMLDAVHLQLTSATAGLDVVRQAAISGGFLYIPMAGTVSAVANTMIVFIVNLTTFALADVTTTVYSTDTTVLPKPTGIVVTANGIILLPTWSSSAGGTYRMYSANVSGLSWSDVSITYRPGCGVAVGDFGYFVENKGTAVAGESIHIIVADATSSVSLSYYDVTTDANAGYLTQVAGTGLQPHTDGTSLFFMCNQVVSDNVANEKPYLARVTLSGMTANGGVFLDEFCSARDYHFGSGYFADGFHYIGGFDTYHPGEPPNFNQGALVRITADFATATVYPGPNVSPPNDNFASAQIINVGDTLGYDNSWATTEASEPGYPGATSADGIYQNNSHSVWFKYVAASTATRTLNTSAGSPALGVVYTGSAIGSLTDIAHSPLSGSAWPFTFSAVSGTTYHIRLVATGNPFPETLSLT